MNLSEWPSNFDRERYEHEWADLISSTFLSDEQKVERIKGSIIKSDAILMNNSNLKTKTSLWVMPFFVDEPNLQFAK